MPRRITIALAGLAIAGLAPASAETPPLTLTPRNDAAHALAWDGWAEPAPAGHRDPVLASGSTALGVEHRSLVARLSGSRRARVTLWVAWETFEDLSVQVETRTGVAARSDNAAGRDESVSFWVDDGMTYLVRVLAKAGAPVPARPQYAAAVWVRQVAGTNTGIARRLRYERPNVCGDRPRQDYDAGGKPYTVPPPACYAALKTPVTIVFVGFDRDEVRAYEPEVAGLFPDHGDPRSVKFKPVIADESSLGGAGLLAREGGPHARELALKQGTAINHLPVAFDFGTPNIIVASEKYSRALFAAAKAATTSGEHLRPWDRAYLAAYGTRGAAFRRDHPVVPGGQADFIDAIRLEDWIARNPPPGVSLNLSKPSGGFTYFVLDTYRPAYAKDYFRPDRFHNFRVMTDATRDPDTGEQRGFDWGRVWGGRYRFMMLDTGAAPNQFEGASTLDAAAYAGPAGGDSAALDPPVWEYSGCAAIDCRDVLPLFYRRIGDNALNALMMRFARGYASRPRAADRWLISGTIWRDDTALQPSRLESLYRHGVVAATMRGLMPFVKVDALARGRNLQEALNRARGQALPGTANTDPVVRFIDSQRNLYAPESPSSRSVPIVAVHLPGATAWSGARPDGSAVPDLGPDPWGVLLGTNDASPGRGMTAPAVRRLAEALGLFPANRGVVFARDLPAEATNPRPHPAGVHEQHRSYYQTVDWTHSTTATPMTGALWWPRFEVLDRDAIALAHAFDWLDRALDDVADAFAALDARGYSAPTKALTAQVMAAGKHMAEMIAAVQSGFGAKAVVSARLAKRETQKALTLAMRTPRARR